MADSYSGLTETEAKEFHQVFSASFLGFTGVVVVAHILAWTWRPWFWKESSLALNDTVNGVAQYLTTLV